MRHVLEQLDCVQLKSDDTSCCELGDADEELCEHAVDDVPPCRHSTAMAWHSESP